jgi:hypothetical protein
MIGDAANRFDQVLQDWMIPSDLAPGDIKSLERDWSEIELFRIKSADDPGFDIAFGALWAEFGARSEVEQPTVLSKRLRWDGDKLIGGYALRYRLVLLKSRGRLAAVRDHTAIVRSGVAGSIVHLSHNFIAPEWRRTGLAGWLRALPIQSARNCLAEQRRSPEEPITLVGEMKALDRNDPASYARLKAYEKAGYLLIDPRRVPYLQPDFRAPDEIDLAGGPKPLSLGLIVRRVGQERELTVSGAETRRIVEALYRVYGETFRQRDMAPVLASLGRYPAPDDVIDLLPPSAELS